jgi:hypothetical protein
LRIKKKDIEIIIKKEDTIERKNKFIEHFFNRISLINFDNNNIRVK